MGNDKKLTVLDAECYNCKEIIVPVDENKEEPVLVGGIHQFRESE